MASVQQYVTLVVQGGTPVRLANQIGAPYPTTGQGALVFSNQPALTGPVTITGDLTYTGTITGPPLTTRGDLYYYGASGVTRLPLGPAGTVLTSNGTDAGWGASGGATLRHVTNRVFIPNNASSNTGVFTRSWQMSYVPLTTISIGLPNWYVNNSLVETTLGGTTTWQAWLEYPVGTYTRLTFSSGATSISSGALTTLYSDVQLLPFTIPAYTKFYLWIAKVNSGGGLCNFVNVPNLRDYANGDLQQASTTSFVPGTITDDNNSSFFCPPVAVLAYSNQHVWAVLGDSNIIGANESSNDITGGRGWFGRALSHVGPHMNMGVSGDAATYYMASHTTRQTLMQQAGVDRLILQYAGNDIFGGLTSSAVLTLRAQIRALNSTLPIFETTVLPVTTSTDSWRTAANQTQFSVPANAQRTTFNNALRRGVAGVTGVIDIAAIMETSTAFEVAPFIDGGVFLPYMVDSTTGNFHTSSQGNSYAPLQEKVYFAVRLAGP